ncbi:MAG: TonB-dependent receptor [Segetibacter sp.]
MTDLNTYGQVNFTKNLYFRSTFGINRSLINQSDFQNKNFGDASSVGGRVYRQQDLINSWTWNNMLNYDVRFGSHHIEAMASYEAYKYYYETIYGSKTGFAFDEQDQLTNAATSEDFQGYNVSSTLLSALGRIKYDYSGKYFAEFTVRRDGSSVFAPGFRYGWFPAAGASWLLSNESFLKGSKTISVLKLRASYGALGNNGLLNGSGNSAYFPYLSTYASGNNDLTYPGVYLNQLANARIQWEKQLNTNIGLDFELFKSRLSGSLDLFQKNSKNLVLNQPLAPSSGFGTVQTNIGKVENAGIELNLSYGIIRSRDLRLDVLFNITYLKNKIQELLPGVDTFAQKGVFRNVVGKSGL